MLQFAIALEYSGPLIGALRHLARMWGYIRMALSLALAVMSATMIHALVLSVVTGTCPPDLPVAKALYTCGMALAALLAVCTGIAIAPNRFTHTATPWLATASILLPALLYIHCNPNAGWRSTYLWYVADTAAGGIFATNFMTWVSAKRSNATLSVLDLRHWPAGLTSANVRITTIQDDLNHSLIDSP